MLRLVRDESGLVLALAVIMIVLINCTNVQPLEGLLLRHGG
jgi:hypothetical protein